MPQGVPNGKDNMYEITSAEYNDILSRKLKEIPEFEPPEWIYYVKSGASRKRPIMEEDFWHKRAASILRQAYIKGVIGVNRLRTRYGGRKDRGHRPPEFRKASGKIIRLILQQAEKADLLKKTKGKRTGRTLTPKGRELIESIKISEKKIIKEVKTNEVVE